MRIRIEVHFQYAYSSYVPHTYDSLAAFQAHLKYSMKMKVPDIKAKLKAAGLSTNGSKTDLATRLANSMAKQEAAAPVEGTPKQAPGSSALANRRSPRLADKGAPPTQPKATTTKKKAPTATPNERARVEMLMGDRKLRSAWFIYMPIAPKAPIQGRDLSSPRRSRTRYMVTSWTRSMTKT